METLLNSLPQIFLLGSVLYFYIFTFLLLTILFIADYHKNGYFAFGSVVVFIAITYFLGTFNPIDYLTWGCVGIYFGIGFLYSLLRTYLFGRKALKYTGYRSDVTEEELVKNREEQIKNRRIELKGNVFRWWFLFPISFIDWVLSDLIKDIYNWVYKRTQKLYERILNLGIKDADRQVYDEK